MNRYSEKKLEIGDSAAADTRVSGVFRAGDTENFALALTDTYPLQMVEAGGSLIIYSNEGER
jgi:ferric-dicitrate binding protein FerR (iron transport regulator)